jgi:hypothetical protein
MLSKKLFVVAYAAESESPLGFTFTEDSGDLHFISGRLVGTSKVVEVASVLSNVVADAALPEEATDVVELFVVGYAVEFESALGFASAEDSGTSRLTSGRLVGSWKVVEVASVLSNFIVDAALSEEATDVVDGALSGLSPLETKGAGASLTVEGASSFSAGKPRIPAGLCLFWDSLSRGCDTKGSSFWPFSVVDVGV